MIHSAVCDIFSIEYPIFQGGMAWISDGKLAAAVSEGGGLGIISAMNANGEYLREQIRIARSLTSKPFGVNVMLLSPHVDEVAMILAEERVPVVTTGAGSISPKHMRLWLDAGIKVVPVVPSVAHARRAERDGASAVIAEGEESGGHIGELTTITIIPQVCDAVSIPVLAAGGIADGRGVAAAFMLGAAGVQLGTRFLVANECGVHPVYKEKILTATDTSTTMTGKRFGHPCRCIKNAFAREYLKAEYAPEATAESVEALGIGALRHAAVEGDSKNGCFLAGQIAGLVKKEQPAADIIREIFEETETLLGGARKWIQ